MIKRLFKKIDVYTKSSVILLDLDGTVYRGQMPLEDVSVLNSVVQDKIVVFITNSGTKTPRDVHVKLTQLGFSFQNLRFHCYTALTHLDNILQSLPTSKNILAISNKDIAINNEATLRTVPIHLASQIVHENAAPSIIIAFFIDTIENLNIDELLTATAMLVTNGAHAYFSAGDNTVPTSENQNYTDRPGPGSIIAILKAMLPHAHHSRIHVFGKGNDRNFMQNALQLAQNATEQCLTWNDVIVVGDNPMTDIAGGLQVGATTVLVNSNTHTTNFDYNRPHFVTDTLANFVSANVHQLGLEDIIDIVTRQALTLHKFISNITLDSLSFCMSNLSKAPIKKTQSLPCKLDAQM